MSRVTGKDKNELLESFVAGTSENNIYKTAIFVRCTEDIETALKSVTDQIKESSESSDRLGNKVLWLNRVIFLATLVCVAATIVIAVKT